MGNIGVRTLFEILLTICAIVFCVILILNSFESDSAASSADRLERTTQQLSSYLAPSVKKESLSQVTGERSDFIGDKYSALFDSCLTTEGTVYSGAIYSYENGMLFPAAKSSAYKELSSDELHELRSITVAGDQVTKAEKTTSITYTPVKDGEGKVFALLVISAERHNSLEYAGFVRNRLLLFAVICCALIVVYFAVSGFISSRRKHKEGTRL